MNSQKRISDPKMRSPTLAALLAYVRSRGGDSAAILRELGLPANAEEAVEIPLRLSQVHALYDAAAREAGDPFLGVHLAEFLPRGSFGLVEFCCRSAPTIGEGLQRLVRYAGIVNELVRVSFKPSADEVVLLHEIPGHPLCVGRHANEFFLTLFIRATRAMTGTNVMPRRVWFAHTEPPDVSLLIDAFGPQISFGRGSNGLALDSSALELPVVSADSALFSVLDRQAEQALARTSSANDYLGEVRDRIHQSLTQGAPDLVAIARIMGTSARSFQRRLREEKTTFNEQVEMTRKSLAEVYIGSGQPLSDVAFRLGFSDVTAFQKAFKRWTGKTPGEHRQMARPAAVT